MKILEMTIFLIASLVWFYLGVKAGEGKKEVIPAKIKLPKVKKRHEESAQEKEARIIYDNIENYGTKVPQKEIK